MHLIAGHFLAAAVTALLAVLAAPDARAMPEAAAELRARYDELLPRLTNNAFGRPLYLESKESESDAQGDVFAVLDYRFPAVSAALTDAANWCEVLILHVNVKLCRAEGKGADATLVVHVGRRFEQPLEDTHPIEFAYVVRDAGPDYFGVQLAAAEGPLSTQDYRIFVEAIPAPDQQTFLHLRYSYGYGAAARVAMRAYLATLGRDFVGFTVAGHDTKGEPEYVRGLVGVLERNAMRYYLAIDAFVAAMDEPPAAQLDARLRHWADAAARYPRQLLDFDRAAYLAMKTNEYARQQAPPEETVPGTGP